MELKDTAALMASADYKERFKAEYLQTVMRHSKLCAMCAKWDAGELNFTPTCKRELYSVQMRVMDIYIGLLEYRAKQEGVELPTVQLTDKGDFLVI